MARLNEPPVPVDSFELLRRKFLRQNRDLARINSNQSLRIRGLENECARLLSENLDLRGQVLRLEKELEDDTSQRVADHALQIKQKMEAQLVELGSLLAGFGVEPPAKRQTPAAPRLADRPARLSLSSGTATPPKRKVPPVLSPTEAESLAAQEGRLPPIYENKTFPRQTLSGEEILALQSDDLKASPPPKLGPPPASHLHHDPTKAAEPTKKPAPMRVQGPDAAPKAKGPAAPKEQGKERVVEALAAKGPPPSLKPKLGAEKKVAALRVLSDKATATDSSAAPTATPSAVPASVPSTPTSKPKGKRKFVVSDENAAIRGMQAGSVHDSVHAPAAKAQTGGSTAARELKNPRSIRSLVNSRKEASENHGDIQTAAGGRKPLAAKSTNEDLSTPRKLALADGAGKPKGKGSHLAGKAAPAEGRVRNRTKATLTVDVPGIPPPTTVDIQLDDDKVANNKPLPEPEAEAPPPCTPPPQAATILTSQRLVPVHAEGRDTPPPADISSQGETSRPNRRSRASVSYAEPNLRDKMRRPTKQLFDAVAGEGKYVQRQSLQTQQDDPPHAACPAVAKADTAEQPPSKKAEEAQAPCRSDPGQPTPRSSSASDPTSTSKPVEEPSTAADQDPYEFTVAPLPSQDTEDEESDAGAGKGKAAKKSSRASWKTSRRSSTATANTRDEGSSAADRHTRPSAARKRTSMVAVKRGSMLDDDEDDAADSSYEPPATESNDAEATEGRALSTRDRITRRRSMML